MNEITNLNNLISRLFDLGQGLKGRKLAAIVITFVLLIIAILLLTGNSINFFTFALMVILLGLILVIVLALLTPILNNSLKFASSRMFHIHVLVHKPGHKLDTIKGAIVIMSLRNMIDKTTDQKGMADFEIPAYFKGKKVYFRADFEGTQSPELPLILDDEALLEIELGIIDEVKVEVTSPEMTTYVSEKVKEIQRTNNDISTDLIYHPSEVPERLLYTFKN